MSKLDGPDGINEVWWDKEIGNSQLPMAKPIPELKPIKSRVKLPDIEDWEIHSRNPGAPQDPRLQWEVDLHNTLTAVRYLLDENKVLGMLSGNTLAILKLAKTSLESEFPNLAQDEKPF